MSNVTRRAFVGAATVTGLLTQLRPAFAEAPAPPARCTDFDQGWKFTKGDPIGAQLAAFDDQSWGTIDLPHDWSILGPYDKDEPTGGSGGYLPTGIGWYRKQFALSVPSKRVRIEFDGVYQRSEVWINGHSFGVRPNGYIGFGYDLTPFLASDGKPNVIAVRVDNALQPNSRWYSGSGIYRRTHLVVTDPVHIAPWGICVRTNSVSQDHAIVEVTARISNGSQQAVSCRLEATVTRPDGGVLATVRARGRVPAGKHHTFVQRVAIPRPEFWAPETPHCYVLQTRLRTTDGQSDSDFATFGIRTIAFDADRGFLLNGQRVKLNGVCLHGDGGAVGAAVPEQIWVRRLLLLKEMGCNAVRCSHNPPAPEFLDLCDTMGFLVMAEAFDEWHQPKVQTPKYGYHRYFDEWASRDLSDMIERDRNHPSIVIWSAGNEVGDQTNPQGPQTLQKLLDIFRAKDPTRPVTVACDNIAAEPKAALAAFLDKLDVVGYNYVDRWRDRREKYYSIDRHDFPGRKCIGTESTSMGAVRGTYQLGDPQPPFGARASNGRIAVEQLQKFVQTYDYVSGDFMWTGIDYLGEARWPNKLASSGVLDTCGFPKDGFYFYQSLWTRKPVLHLFPHWNWQGKEGRVVAVTCYTNCDTVELFLNGKTFGTKGFAFPRPGMVHKWPEYPPRAMALQTTADLHLSWDVPYEPGTLKAVGITDGTVALTTEIRTTGAPQAIRLTADKAELSTSRSDVAHVKVEVIDKDGLLVPTAEDEILFALQGAGRILGIDSGRPDSHESYQSNRRKVFNGLALVLLQSRGEKGSMTLLASAPSLASAKLDVTTV